MLVTPFLEDVARVIFVQLELVPDHRHLGDEVLLRDVAVDHPVGFEVERPGEVRVAGREGLVVVGAIGPGGAVGIGAMLRQFLRNVRVTRRALEHEVLEQVRHPGLTVVLVPGPDEVDDVDRGRRLRLVGEEQEDQAVRQGVLGDALDGRSLHRPGRRGLPGRGALLREERRGDEQGRGSEQQETRRCERNDVMGTLELGGGGPPGAGMNDGGRCVTACPLIRTGHPDGLQAATGGKILRWDGPSAPWQCRPGAGPLPAAGSAR